MTSRIPDLANAGDSGDGPPEMMNNNGQFTVGQEHKLDPTGRPGDRADSA